MAAAHDRQRALDGSFRAGVRALENLRATGIPVSVNTQINAWSWTELLEVLVEQLAHAWQRQLTVPMGWAAERPEILLQPYQLLEVFPVLAHPLPRADGARPIRRAR